MSLLPLEDYRSLLTFGGWDEPISHKPLSIAESISELEHLFKIGEFDYSLDGEYKESLEKILLKFFPSGNIPECFVKSCQVVLYQLHSTYITKMVIGMVDGKKSIRTSQIIKGNQELIKIKNKLMKLDQRYKSRAFPFVDINLIIDALSIVEEDSFTRKSVESPDDFQSVVIPFWSVLYQLSPESKNVQTNCFVDIMKVFRDILLIDVGIERYLYEKKYKDFLEMISE